MIDKAYVEITNVCNLSCSFCAGHKREPRRLSPDEFAIILSKLDRRVKYLYLHLMGEPLTHPELDQLLSLADTHDFKIMLTTNGTLLEKKQDTLLSCSKLYKISISLHSFEGSDEDRDRLDNYLDSCFDLAEKSSQKGIITVFRLWNEGGEDRLNAHILDRLHRRFQSNWTKNRSGEKIADKLFLEWGEKFEWPSEDARCEAHEVFCYALRDQFGILSDGTVVPCCLDHDGVLALGNIFESTLDEILNSERARRIYDGFTRRRAAEEYCLSCKRPNTYNINKADGD